LQGLIASRVEKTQLEQQQRKLLQQKASLLKKPRSVFNPWRNRSPGNRSI
jgi:hypothetical protein